MLHYLLVGVGGALGAMARYGVYNAFLRWTGGAFPWATLTVNVLGSLVLGGAFVLFTERSILTSEWRTLVAAGFLGAFTTFSTFAVEAVGLLQEGAWTMALGHILGNVLLCLLSAALGIMLTRAFF